ncbi:hypothetical protein [Streptomyces coffeae]|uniref:Uncharacterized protein n=1 Tax=Streptomyces coffeae TaxID=621382 RepID=A0ABS1NJ15_9ACTN|nr:hypothetical protein [Streptomyces coffeae]MBL1100097.1 hypothetical protein [Streptomyces coffeae]
MKRRDSFSDSGFWRPADRTGRAPSIGTARDRALFDHQPRRRGLITRLTNKIAGGRG